MPSSQNDASRSPFVSLDDEEGVKQILSATIMSLWDAVNELTRLRPSKRERCRVAHKTFFTRLHHVVIASDAFVVAPGGIGTCSRR